MATLIIIDGPASDQKFSLAEHKLVMLGRDASCTIQIVDPQLSRHHLQIVADPTEKRHYALDYNSRNGISVNGLPVKDRQVLEDGDVIEAGISKIVYSMDDSVDADHIRASLKRFGQGRVQTEMPE